MDFKQIFIGVVTGAVLSLVGGGLVIWKDISVLKEQNNNFLLKSDIPESPDLSGYALKSEMPVSAMPKHSVVAFNLSACPEGWKYYSPSEGRYIVGLYIGGSLGAVVGNKLVNEENRPTGDHQHNYLDSDLSAGGKRARLGGYSNLVDKQRVTIESGLVNGTNSPYVQLLFCQKT